MTLDIGDLKYVSKKLAVSSKIIKKIADNDKDTDLILDQVATKRFKKRDITKINPLTYLKLVIFRHSKDLPYDISEKTYIASSIYNNYNNIKDNSNYHLICTDKIGESRSQYLITLAGLFSNRVPINILYPNYKEEIVEGIKDKKEIINLPAHLDTWIGLLKDINKKRWLE